MMDKEELVIQRQRFLATPEELIVDGVKEELVDLNYWQGEEEEEKDHD